MTTVAEFARDGAPDDIRALLEDARSGRILTPSYPHKKRLKRKRYEAELTALQIELAKYQAHSRSTGGRLVMVFEGRDAAGKGGTIKRFTQHLNPRAAKVVALPAPSESERSEWYFQRYIKELPSAGEMSLFDRSWYNRGVVEKVFGFCTDVERERFFEQAPGFERMLVEDGVTLVKFWLSVGRAEQIRRFLAREQDPLKHWKLSRIDIDGLSRWDAYTNAITETLRRTHSAHAPWVVIRSDDKRRARLEAIRHVLSRVDYEGKDEAAIGSADRDVIGGPDMLYG